MIRRELDRERERVSRGGEREKERVTRRAQERAKFWRKRERLSEERDIDREREG